MFDMQTSLFYCVGWYGTSQLGAYKLKIMKNYDQMYEVSFHFSLKLDL
jgi:hypothetical protein